MGCGQLKLSHLGPIGGKEAARASTSCCETYSSIHIYGVSKSGPRTLDCAETTGQSLTPGNGSRHIDGGGEKFLVGT